MLKINLILNAIKNFSNVFIYTSIALFALNVYFNLKLEIKKGKQIEKNLKEQILLQYKKDSLTIITLAKKNKKLSGLYKLQTEYTLSWKEKYENLKAAQDTVNSRIKVSFEKETNCVFISGYTLTDPPACPVISFTLKPIKIETKYMQIDNKVYSILHPENNCITISGIKTEVPPEFINYRNKGFGWKEFFAGSAITSLVFLLK